MRAELDLMHGWIPGGVGSGGLATGGNPGSGTRSRPLRSTYVRWRAARAQVRIPVHLGWPSGRVRRTLSQRPHLLLEGAGCSACHLDSSLLNLMRSPLWPHVPPDLLWLPCSPPPRPFGGRSRWPPPMAGTRQRWRSTTDSSAGACARAGQPLILPSGLGFGSATRRPSEGLRITDTTRTSHDEWWTQPWGEVARVHEHYNELAVSVEEAVHRIAGSWYGCAPSMTGSDSGTNSRPSRRSTASRSWRS